MDLNDIVDSNHTERIARYVALGYTADVAAIGSLGDMLTEVHMMLRTVLTIQEQKNNGIKLPMHFPRSETWFR